MWNTDGLRDATGGEAAHRLVELLESLVGKAEYKLPHVLRTAKPLIIARDFGQRPFSHPRDKPGEFYSFQLGPRSWSKMIFAPRPYDRPSSLPRYEQEAEKLAQGLKAGAWEMLARSLFDDTVGRRSSETADTFRVLICWQDDGRFLALHDLESGQAIAFNWTESGLELLGNAHPRPLNNLRRAPQSPVLSVAAGGAQTAIGQKAGQIDELRAEIAWRYATKLDPSLDGLLLEACDRLEELEGDLGIAFARHRFNDASGDDHWLAARVGNFAWENGAYFRSDAASLRGAPQEIGILVGVLAHLQACGISYAFEASFGYKVESLDVLGLFRDAGTWFFACCNSNEGSGPVYVFDRAHGKSSLFGFTGRFDWNFNSGRRACGLIPRPSILETIGVDELIRMIEGGDVPSEGPPNDLNFGWRLYLPNKDPVS